MQKTCNGTLYLIRGCSGSGKSTVAEGLYTTRSVHFEADMFHYNEDGVYDWKPQNLKDSHKWCQDNVRAAMEMGVQRVIVSNTFTAEKELSPYLVMAKENRYKVVSIVVENRHGNNNVHSVPKDIVDAQERRLRNSLKLIP